MTPFEASKPSSISIIQVIQTKNIKIEYKIPCPASKKTPLIKHNINEVKVCLYESSLYESIVAGTHLFEKENIV